MHKKNTKNILWNFWKRITTPSSNDEDSARREYMTKVILVFLSLVIIPFFIISLIASLVGVIPIDTVIILGLMCALFIFGWYISHKGHSQIGGAIPCFLMLAAGAYGNYVGGIDAPAMLLYALAIVIAVITLNFRLQLAILALSLISYFGIGLAHYTGVIMSTRSASNMFVNRVSIVAAALTAITLGVWFLSDQYRRSLSVLRTNAENKKAILETVVDGIVFSDLQGKIVDLNSSMMKMFQLDNREQVLGKTIFDFLTRKDAPIAQESYLQMAAKMASGSSIIYSGLRLDGKNIILEIKSAVFVDQNGQPAGYVSTVRDITEQKQTEQELEKYREHLEEMVSERTSELKDAYTELESFSYSISHDLKSPLRGIEGYVTLLSKDYKDQLSGQALNYLQHINEGIATMAELINDLLTFSRLFRHPVSRKQVNLDEIVRTVTAELIREDYKTHTIELQIDEVPYCDADPVLMRQVIFNLFDNAFKYSRNKEKALVQFGSKSGDDGEIVYYVKDNGVGFDMQYADNLFGVFQRLHNEREYEGTGIGLATVQRIIRRHNGKIWAESQINQGTTFFFTLGQE